MYGRYYNYLSDPEHERLPEPSNDESSLVQQALSAVSTVAKVGAAALIFRGVANTGLLDELGDYLLAGAKTYNRYLSNRLPGEFSLDALKQTFREALDETRARYNAAPFELERLLQERRNVLNQIRDSYEAGTIKLASELDDLDLGRAAKSIDQTAIEQSIARLQQQIDEEIISRLGQTKGPIARLAGHRYLTVGEAMEQGLLSDEAQSWVQEVIESHADVNRLRVDRFLTVDAHGRRHDLRSWDEIANRTLNWWSNTIPGGLLHLRDFSQDRVAPFATLITGGPDSGYHPALRFYEDIQRAAQGQLDEINASPRNIVNNYLAVGERVIDLAAPDEPVLTGMKIVSGRYGTRVRMLRNMEHLDMLESDGGPHTLAGRALGFLELDKALDVGYQSGPTSWDSFIAFTRKGQSPRWVPNIVRQLEENRSITHGQFQILASFIDEHTGGFNQRVINALRDVLPDEFRDLDFSDADKTIESLLRVQGRLPKQFRLEEIADQIQTDLPRYRNRVHLTRHRLPFLGYVESQRGDFYVRRDLTYALLEQFEETGRGRKHIKQYLDEALQAKRISQSDYNAAMDAIVGHEFRRNTRSARRAISRLRRTNEGWDAELVDDLGALQGMLSSESDLREPMLDLVKRRASKYSYGPYPNTSPDEFSGLGTSYTVMKRSGLRQVRNMNDAIKVLGELGGGRHNLLNVTDLTIIPYHALNRLSEALESAGLGLSSRSTDSVKGLAVGIFGKRMLAGYLGFKTLSYLSYEVRKATGLGLEDRYWRTAAASRLELARMADNTGLTPKLKRFWEITPGLEVFSGAPFVGWMFEEPRSEEELEEYYRSGTRPMRKGRWWGFGSSSSYYGDRVSYYLPNEYVMGRSQYKMTSTLYGSEDEYWSYSWIPTPAYPLSPIKRLLDPYYLERKHYHDRPYPLTGEMFEPTMPGGALLNATIGQLLKPVRPMHQEDLRQQEPTVGSAPMGPVIGVTSRGTIIPQVFVPVPQEGGIYSAAPVGYPGAGVQGVPVGSSAGSQRVLALNQGMVQAGGKPLGTYQEVRLPQSGSFVPSDYFLPTDLRYRMSETIYSATELAGIYGFIFEELTGGSRYSGRQAVQTAQRMGSLERSFWDTNLGGLGGEISEIYRRFLPHRRRDIKEWNPIRNTMPEWLPGANYFVDYQTGDPYTKIPHGEVRLPGEAYEKTHTLHSDPWFGKYGAFERFKILADVAPYSEEYKLWRDTVRQMLRSEALPSTWREEFNRILKQVDRVKTRYELYPYKFSRAHEVTRQTVTIERFLDANTFITKEIPDHPIRLAGVRLNSSAPLSDFLPVGSRVQIIMNRNPAERVSDDSLKTIRATVMVGDQNLNRQLLLSGVAKEKSEDSPAALWAKYSPAEINWGADWEKVAHLNIPILHNKFVPINSPLEFYRRKLVYGKDWQTWSHPIRDFIVPTYESYIAQNPISATILGGFSGGLIGQVFFGGGTRTKWGAGIGAAVTGIGSLLRIASEALSGERWIPERRQREREIEEYFDILEYMKFRGLYEHAAAMAKRKEGVDIDRILNTLREEYRERRDAIKALEEQKRQLVLQGKDANAEQIDAIEQQIAALHVPQQKIPLKPWTLKAVQYRAQYESTLYGLDPHTTDWRMIYRALPFKDREFFQYFASETDPKKRREILELVPRNQRRLYQAIWGMRVDRRPSLEEYFRTHKLPDKNWIGWKPNVDLDLIKVKVVRNEALDMSEFNLWDDDLQQAEALGIPELDIFEPNRLMNIRQTIMDVLKGRGLQDISIDILETESPGITLDMDIMQDRQADMQRMIEDLIAG